MTRSHRSVRSLDPARYALDLVAGVASARPLAAELVEAVRAELDGGDAALFVWDPGVGATYPLAWFGGSLGTAPRTDFVRALEAAWEATSAPLVLRFGNETIHAFALFRSGERVGLLAVSGAGPETLLRLAARFVPAAFHLTAAAAERIERDESVRRSRELQETRARLERALAGSQDQQHEIERMAARLERAHRDLERSHDELEEIVQERTRELANANESLREATRRAEAANEAKGRFLAIMSHELRTPLTSILGAAELLAAGIGGCEADALIRSVQRAGEDVLGIVTDVLHYSRIAAGDLSGVTVDIRVDELLANVAAHHGDAARERSLALLVENRMPAGALLRSDPEHVGKILQVLVDNAIKYTETGRVEVTLEPHFGAVAFAVRDTGPGIPEEARERAFAPFEQVDTSNARRFEGAGLGLAIAQGLAERLGGSLELESEHGQGCTFRLVLPADRLTLPAAAGREPAERSVDFTGRSALLVEDNPVNRRIVGRLLQKLGFTLLEACDGVEAVEVALSRTPDLVLMDIQMPHMDGIEATLQIRAAGALMPIVALTANATPEERERALGAGMGDFLTKPVRLEVLRSALASAVSA